MWSSEQEDGRPVSEPATVDLGAPLPILVVGELGPSPAELVGGSNVLVSQAPTVASALERALIERPRLALVRGRFPDGTAAELTAQLRGVGARVPVVVLLERREWALRDAAVQAGAAEVVEIDDLEQILFVSSRLLGLDFGRGLRVDFDAAVAMSIGDDRHVVRAVDLRTTGLAFAGGPVLQPGSLVRLRFELVDRTLECWARVARTWRRGGDILTGLMFIGLSRDERTWIEGAVGILKATDFFGTAEPVEEEHTFDEDPDDPFAIARWHLARALRNDGAREERPAWMHAMIPELTPIERSGVLGVKVPDWVHRAVRVRLMLARFRSEHPLGAPPPAITDECQSLMDVLSKEREDAQEFAVAEQIGLIKGRIIQEFLEGPGQAPVAAPSDDAPMSAAEFLTGDIHTRAPVTATVDIDPVFTPVVGFAAVPRPAPELEASERRDRAERSERRDRAERSERRDRAERSERRDRRDRLEAIVGRDEPSTEAPPRLPPPSAGFARRAALPLALVLIATAGGAVAARLIAARSRSPAPPTLVGEQTGSELFTRVESVDGFAFVTVSPIWFARDEEARRRALRALEPALQTLGAPARHLVVESAEAEPIGMFRFDPPRWVELTRPSHLILSTAAGERRPRRPRRRRRRRGPCPRPPSAQIRPGRRAAALRRSR